MIMHGGPSTIYTFFHFEKIPKKIDKILHGITYTLTGVMLIEPTIWMLCGNKERFVIHGAISALVAMACFLFIDVPLYCQRALQDD